MLDIMYEIPSEDSVTKEVINEEVILRKENPLVLYEDEPAQLQALIRECVKYGFAVFREPKRVEPPL